MKMISFELKKYVLKPSILAFALLFIFINLVKFFEIYYYFGGGRYEVAGDASISGFDKLYPIYGGKITQEKIDGINAEYAEAQQKLNDRGMGDTVYDDCYTGYPYGDVELFKNNIIPGYEYAIFYSNRAEELSAAAEENVEFYNGINDYEVRKNKLISNVFKGRYVNYYVKSDGWKTLFDYKFSTILVMLMIVLAFSQVFSGERAGGFDKLIVSSGKRKAAIRAKLISSGVFTFSATALFFLLDVLYVAVFHGLYCFGAPVYAISEYANCPFTITLFSAMLLSFIGRLIAMLFFVSLTNFISSFWKNTALSLFLSITSGAGLIVLSDILPDSLNPLGLAYSSHFFEKFSVENIFGIPVFTVVIAALFTVLLTVALNIVTSRRALK
ncbi:MAG: ABC transporter permease subunit [Oscillospiraceae bacterium]|nr:ABC transporter permease subunit [Oscillospiraceae bacterium]